MKNIYKVLINIYKYSNVCRFYFFLLAACCVSRCVATLAADDKTYQV